MKRCSRLDSRSHTALRAEPRSSVRWWTTRCTQAAHGSCGQRHPHALHGDRGRSRTAAPLTCVRVCAPCGMCGGGVCCRCTSCTTHYAARRQACHARTREHATHASWERESRRGAAAVRLALARRAVNAALMMETVSGIFFDAVGCSTSGSPSHSTSHSLTHARVGETRNIVHVHGPDCACWLPCVR